MRKSFMERYLHIRLDLRSLGAFPSPGASAPVSNQSRPFRPADAQLPVPTAFPYPLHTPTTPYPHRILTVVPLIAYQRYYGEDTVRIWTGSGDPGDENGAKPGLVSWRNGRFRRLPQVTDRPWPLMPSPNSTFTD